MLSLEHPEIVSQLAEAGPGLWPFREPIANRVTLAIKGSSDLALAAKMQKSLKFHLYALHGDDGIALGIVTAVYDRSSAPIVVLTIASNEAMRRHVQEMINSSRLGIHFFDTHNSELFGGEWSVIGGDQVNSIINECTTNLPPNATSQYYIALRQRFQIDDGCVVEAKLDSANRPDNVSMIHLTQEEVNSRRGEGQGIYQSRLTVENRIGDYHEAEIARLLMRAYPAESIYLNPDIGQGKEFCDILALGKHEALAVQAKSFARTEERALEQDDKRISRLRKIFTQAVKQARGAERAFYILRKGIDFDGTNLPILPTTTLLIHIIVIPEKNPSLLEEWSKEIEGFIEANAPIVVLEMSELIAMLNVYRSRETFLSALWTLVTTYKETRKIGDYMFSHERIATFTGQES